VSAEHWGLGTNHGDPEADSEALVARLAADGDDAATVTLVGWSLGGVIAREVARQAPHRVARVITYGTPVVGGPTYTPAAGVYGEAECRRIRRRVDELDAESPITTPISAIFTRNDSVVSWPACIDRRSPNVRHFEVRSTHISMGFDPDVWTLVLEQLR
jgi:pimeloyl-ACP methyl ester carboxylesterase